MTTCAWYWSPPKDASCECRELQMHHLPRMPCIVCIMIIIIIIIIINMIIILIILIIIIIIIKNMIIIMSHALHSLLTLQTFGSLPARVAKPAVENFWPPHTDTPNPPTKSFPTKSPWVKLCGRLPIKFYGHENSHPLELRVCLSQTLRNPNS